MEISVKRSNSGLFLATLLSTVVIIAIVMGFTHFPIHSYTLLFYAALALFTIFRSRTGIVFIILSFPIVSKSFASITGTYHSSLHYACFYSTIFLIFYGNIIGYELRFPRLLQDKVLLLFLVYLFFSTRFITSERIYAAEKFKYFINNIILFYVPILLVKKERDFEEVIKGVAVFGLFFTGYALLSHLGFEQFYGNSVANRFSTLDVNPIWVGRYLTYSILAELYFLLKLARNASENIGKIALLVVLIIFQLYFSFLTASRGPLLALILGIVVTILVAIRFRITHLIISALIILIIFFAVLYFIPSEIEERLLSQDQRSMTTSYLRIMANINALEMFWDNKIFGAGLGAFNIYYLKYPHNLFTEVMAELGLIGITLFLTTLILAVIYLFRLSRYPNKLCFYLLIAFFSTALVNINLSGHIGTNYYLFFSLGLIYSVMHSYHPTSKDTDLAL
ncbi:MAG: O-antigen ligase family protein [Candidatus Cloacimonadia bacterium]